MKDSTWKSIAPPDLQRLRPGTRTSLLALFGVAVAGTAVMVGVAISTLGGCGALGFGRGAAAGACTVVDAAHDACAIVRYLDTDGTAREVRVPADELREFGRAVSARRTGAPAP